MPNQPRKAPNFPHKDGPKDTATTGEAPPVPDPAPAEPVAASPVDHSPVPQEPSPALGHPDPAHVPDPNPKPDESATEDAEPGILMWAPKSYGPDCTITIGEAVLMCDEDGRVFVPEAHRVAVAQAGFTSTPPEGDEPGHGDFDDGTERLPHQPQSMQIG